MKKNNKQYAEYKLAHKRSWGKSGLLARADCENCPLLHAPGPVFGKGNLAPETLLVAEAPGRVEDEVGAPMMGPSGELNDKLLVQLGSHRDRQYVTNTVLCRPLDNESKDTKPPLEAVEACSQRLQHELRQVKSKFILATGGTAINSLLKQPLDTAVGTQLGALKDCRLVAGKKVIPSYHPAFILRDIERFPMLRQSYSTAITMAQQNKQYKPEGWMPSYSIKSNFAAIDAALATIAQEKGTWALDTETAFAGDETYELIMLQLSNGARTYVLDYRKEWPRALKARFAALLADPDITWVIHNSAFDMKYLLYHFGQAPVTLHDTMALALCLSEKPGDIGLKVLSRRWLGAGDYEKEIESHGKIGPNNPMTKIDFGVLAKYGALDAWYTQELLPVLMEQVEKEERLTVYRLMLDAQYTFADMEMVGITIDPEKVNAARSTWEPKVAAALKDLQDYAELHGFKATDVVAKPKDLLFNPSSVPQVKHLVYKLLNLKKAYELNKKTQKRVLTTGKKFFEANPDAHIVELIKTYRKMNKMLGTYINGMTSHAWSDWRVRPSYQLWGTRTGRISTKDPNLQNIPRDKTVGDNFDSIKAIFRAQPGHLLIEADYTSLEVWIAYHYSEDPALYEALKDNLFHETAASRAFQVPLEQVTPAQRQDSKVITYGIMFGQEIDGLARNLKRSKEEAGLLLDNWLAVFPVFRDWREEIKRKVLAEGELRTLLGRSRRWEIKTPQTEDTIVRQALNFPIQSLASDLCLLSLIEVNRALKDTGLGRAVLTVHDSIECEVPEENVEEVAKLVKDIMSRPKFETIIESFPVGVEAGSNWGAMLPIGEA